MSPSTWILPLRSSAGQRSHARQVVRRLRKRKPLFDPLVAAMHRLPNATVRSALSKHLFDAFAFPLAYLLAGPTCRPAINGRAAPTRVVPRHMRRYTVGATGRHEACLAMVLAGADHDGRRYCGGGIGKRLDRRIALSGPVRRQCDLRIGHRLLPVIAQHIARIAKYGAGPLALAKQTRPVIGRRFLRGVAAFLAARVLVGRLRLVRWRFAVRLGFGRETLVSCPRLLSAIGRNETAVTIASSGQREWRRRSGYFRRSLGENLTYRLTGNRVANPVGVPGRMTTLAKAQFISIAANRR
ncbi:transposase [Pandoraea communis]|uniref:Transposase n=1 Tax=Pandoraea communis TaxID=2508297 RepID=A0A5E4XDS4_9BURK|nr:transposase [Pandoraea communis]